ncbi:iron-sulfur cluster insertion protein ErpA [Buchnera aphidicola (Mindarus keteleerifoliae)]|uniref:iron-sulfur cluster insertion protein ErpA n=1 Tax=Buchnera aphidicola TaxID=9 RepID=UPI0031B73779
MSEKNQRSIFISKTAKNKIIELFKNKKNKNLKFRIYITGGGCTGFKYGFIFDEKINKKDIFLKKDNVPVIIDHISFQYLIGGTLDFIENLEGSKFTISNPNAKITCGCGLSFSV